MDIIDKKLFHEGSFVDEEVFDAKLDLDNKTMVIDTSGALLETGDFLSKAKIIIENWEKLELMERDKYGIRSFSDYEFALDRFSIIEFHWTDYELKLVDVGKNCWIDWIFTKPKVTIYGEIDPNPPKFE